MYRFVKKQGFAVKSACFMSRQVIIQPSMQVCSFCNVYHSKLLRIENNLQTHRRTIINTTQVHFAFIKKNMKQKLKKYAELLEVTDKITNNRRIAVKRLSGNHLSAHINQPNVIFDKLYETHYPIINSGIRKFRTHAPNTNEITDNDLYTERNMNIWPNPKLLKESEDYFYDKATFFEDLKDSGISDNTALIKNSSFLDSLNVFKPEYKKGLLEKKLKKGGKNVYEAHEKNTSVPIGKNKTYTNYLESLTAHIQVYVDCGMIDKAYKILLVAKNKRGSKVKMIDKYTDLYNIILEGYASKEHPDQALEIYKSMIKCSVPPNSQTFISMLESIGKMKNINVLDTLKTVISQMKENGISLNDIFNKGQFKINQQQNILKVIKILEPDFEPVYAPPDTEYNCTLLNKLSETTRQHNLEEILSYTALQDALNTQLQIEKENEIKIKSIESYNDIANVEKCRKKISELENLWEETVSNAFDKNLRNLKEKEESSPVLTMMMLHPFLQVLDKKVYVNAIIREMRNLAKGSELFSAPLSILYIELGRQIYRKYEIQTKIQNGVVDKTIQIYKNYLDWYLNKNTSHGKDYINSRTAWQTFEHEAQKDGASLNKRCITWPRRVYLPLGRFLYNIILNDVKIHNNTKYDISDQFSPAFYTLFRGKGKGMSEEIRPHPYLTKLYRGSRSETLSFDATLVPSLCPIRPWTSIHAGGYIITETDLMRAPMNATYLWDKLECTSSKQLYPSFDSLNQLGSVPWTINTAVLDIIIKLFQSGGSETLSVPQPPSILLPLPPLNKDVNPIEKYKIIAARARIKRKSAELYSLWCDALYRLSLANHFRDKIFWLPHNMDFRGRVYPLPPHLNHLGSDIARSILVFAYGKPLGPNGLDWLKLHVINLTGFKKRDSIAERLRYANENLDKIIDSAEHPMTGEKWWMTSEEPWQTLAACMEIAAALRCENPEKYISKFPIHQDGSCNGLQHYAALGRDQIGAESVNLFPSSRPQDVYSEVVAMVDEKRRHDASNGHEIAKALEGYITRKVIKQTVMTTVYGVTKFGAKLQIIRQLKDIDNFPDEYVWSGGGYLTEKTFESLRTMFKSAKEIQDWFTECAHTISTTCNKTVEWVTPLGLPVIQPYYKCRKNATKSDGDANEFEKPDSVKQKNAFPPNFVHSLDSSHMMLTSIYSEQAGITFMSVHDCYWTHACSVEIMNKICREQFVALHSEPILENLSEYFLKIYIENYKRKEKRDDEILKSLRERFTRIPKKGTFELKEVLSSVYFFS